MYGHINTCVSIDFSQDGSLLASGSHDGTAIIWSTTTWKTMHTLQNPEKSSLPDGRITVEDVAFSPDGKTLALASYGGTVQLWDVATGKLLETLKGHSSAVMAVVFSPDGRTLASGSSDQTVRLWNVETRRELMQLDHGGVELGIRCYHSRFPRKAGTCLPEGGEAPHSGPPCRSSGTIPTGPPKNCDSCSIPTPTSRAASGCCPKT